MKALPKTATNLEKMQHYAALQEQSHQLRLEQEQAKLTNQPIPTVPTGQRLSPRPGVDEKETNQMKTITVTTILVARLKNGKVSKKETKNILTVPEISNAAIKAAYANFGLKLRGRGRRNRQTGIVTFPLAVETQARRQHRLTEAV